MSLSDKIILVDFDIESIYVNDIRKAVKELKDKINFSRESMTQRDVNFSQSKGTDMAFNEAIRIIDEIFGPQLTGDTL